MCQPLYFLPDLRSAACDSVPLLRSVLRERGLWEVFADVPDTHTVVAELTGRGPGGKSGVILYYQTATGEVPRRSGYTPDEQSWSPVADGSLVWIGVDPSEPPKPEEMARRRQYRGYSLECGDGQRWQVPIIRRPDGSTELPRDMVYDSAGRYSEPLKAAYAAYWDEIGEFAEWYYGGMDPEGFSRERGLQLATRALSLNYRFGPHEQNALRIIDADCYLTILAAAVDAPTWTDIDEAQKKMRGQSSIASISPGLPAASATTDLAMANSS